MSKQRFAFTVTDAFVIQGLGLLLTPGIGTLAVPLQIGAALRLVRPDGSTITTRVEVLHPVHGAAPDANLFLVLPNAQPTDVPPGTIVEVGG